MSIHRRNWLAAAASAGGAALFGEQMGWSQSKRAPHADLRIVDLRITPIALPDPPILAAFTVAVAVLIIMPGPDMALFLGKTLSQGRTAGLAAMLGASAGLMVHTLFAAFGLSALLAASETAGPTEEESVTE